VALGPGRQGGRDRGVRAGSLAGPLRIPSSPPPPGGGAVEPGPRPPAEAISALESLAARPGDAMLQYNLGRPT
jgi:hypothetical protein